MSTEYEPPKESPYQEEGIRPDEYFEEADNKILSFVKPKKPRAPPEKKPVFIPLPPPPPIDPVKQLSDELNRKYRPDLVPPTPVLIEPVFVPAPVVPPRILTPNPVIYDSRAKPAKPVKEQESSTSFKERIFQRLNLNKFNGNSVSSTMAVPSNHATVHNTGYVPPGMMLVPDPSYRPAQANPFPTNNVPSSYQQHVMHPSHSMKINQVAPPALQQQQIPTLYPIYNGNNSSYFTSNSGLSSYPLLQPSVATNGAHGNIPPSQMETQKFSNYHQSSTINGDRAYALYNKQNGRIEGVVKNKLNVISDDEGENKLTDDDEPQEKSAMAVWCSQPLCMGLTRLSGGLLFGVMLFLGLTAIAGLIASAVTYSQDNVTNAQWKILGIVVCSIMLITIIVTLIIFICCYKNGYMFNNDVDDDPTDSSDVDDPDGQKRKKAVLRKIYKFNRPNESSITPGFGQVNTVTPGPIYQPTVLVTDKQTNTETTIAKTRPRDFHQGVWTSVNAYGGRVLRPLVAPKTFSRVIQVFPHEIEAAYAPQKVIYEVVAPAVAVSPVQESTRYLKIPAPQAPVYEVIEKTRKPIRTQVVRKPVVEEVISPTATQIEYVEYEEPRVHRTIRQPQYQIVEEVVDDRGTTDSEEYVEVVDMEKHGKHRERRRNKRKGFGKIAVKHIKAPH